MLKRMRPSYELRQLERLLVWVDQLTGVAQLMWQMLELEEQQELWAQQQLQRQEEARVTRVDEERRRLTEVQKMRREDDLQRKLLEYEERRRVSEERRKQLEEKHRQEQEERQRKKEKELDEARSLKEAEKGELRRRQDQEEWARQILAEELRLNREFDQEALDQDKQWRETISFHVPSQTAQDHKTPPVQEKKEPDQDEDTRIWLECQKKLEDVFRRKQEKAARKSAALQPNGFGEEPKTNDEAPTDHRKRKAGPATIFFACKVLLAGNLKSVRAQGSKGNDEDKEGEGARMSDADC